ncbi:MAG: MFS transporter [Streptomyces sp.]|nr:MFS transporter [Streptomyces sp.]
MTTDTLGTGRGPARESGDRGRDRGDAAHGRRPVMAVFFLTGLTLGSFLVRQPSLKAAHHFSDGQVGALGMFFASAALVSMQFVGRLVARHGGDRVLRLALPALPAALACVALASGPAAYLAAVVVLGAVNGTLDVAMNAQAVAVERLRGRPVLSGCHAAWSVGAVVASLVGVVLVRAGTPLVWHLSGVAAAVLVAGLVLGPALPLPSARPGTAVRTTKDGQAQAAGGGAGPAWRTGWTRQVLRLGITGTVLMVCEGAALGWSGIFLRDDRGATLAVASAAVTAFTGCQTAGRLFGDRLRLRHGDTALFRTGGLIGAAGLALAVLSPAPVPAVAGFAVLGLGTSVLIPITFSTVGHAAQGDHGSAAALSRFTTFTYAGILLGPALIGWAAQLCGLGWTLAALIPMLACVTLTVRLR